MLKSIYKISIPHRIVSFSSSPRRLLGGVALAAALLLHAGAGFAADEEVDEKMIAPQTQPGQAYPGQPAPAQPGAAAPGYAPPTYVTPGTPVIIDPSAPGQIRPGQPGEAPYGPYIPGAPSPAPSTPEAAPGQIFPEKGGQGVIVPVLPGQSPDPGGAMPVVPAQPDKTAPAVITPAIPAPVVPTPVVPAPAQPVQPKIVEPKVIAPVQPVQPTMPPPDKKAQQKGDPGPLSPAQFLPTTTIPGEGKATPAAEKQPDEKQPRGKDQPKVKEPPTPKAPKEPKVAPPKGAPAKGEPPAGEPPKKGPRAKEPPKETAKSGKPKPGDPLRIPPEAVQTGKLDFLEGCWRGTRPEYATKRIITERFCFDANGKGKRHIVDSAYAGECFGATQGKLDSGGKLVVSSEMGYCSGGQQWAPAQMECRGEGQETPCYWNFKGPGGGSQSYKIPFVRE